MSNFEIILLKLEQFTKKYYLNELLKGIIFFFAIGLLYFLFTLFIEYVLWLSQEARAILFWLFIIAELALFIKFIVLPLAKLFKLQKGIAHKDASLIIGKHFSEVNDKLLNLLQLKQDTNQSDLLLASIEQKSAELKPVPFKLAINLNKNVRYLKYVAIPLAIIVMIVLTGRFNLFSDSYKRVVNYKTAYEPPAPFQFFLLNESLNAIENKDFKVLVKTAGDVMPENAQITFDGESYFLKNTGSGSFEYVFSKAQKSVNFRFKANNVTSRPYTLNIVEVPSLIGFEMVLDYPAHTRIVDETLRSTGNTVVPEGTKVTWKLQTKSTENVFMYANDTVDFNQYKPNKFNYSKQLYNNFDYALSTSNTRLKDYEKLSFRIDVVKDEYPRLDVKMETDSTDMQTLYFLGQASDDYGINSARLVYYPSEDQNDKQSIDISISPSNVVQFVSAFPDVINVEEGIAYDIYFEVFDNDAINNHKSSKSNVFVYRKRTKDEEAYRKLEEQSETIRDLNKSLEKFKDQEKQLDELTNTQKEKSEFNFGDKKKLESFLKRQAQQDEMMKNFNKKLKENLEQFQKESNKEDEFKQDLEKRLDENEEKLKKDEKLLDELRELQEKLSQEELVDKLEELAKQNKNKKRSLEQLLELTKRFYVEKKLEKLKDDLMKQAIEQEKLSNEQNENNTTKSQEDLNKKFEDFKKQMDQLEKENKSLKKPMDIPRDKLDEKEVENEQNKASEQLERNEQENSSQEKNSSENKQNDNLKNAQKSQKNAAQKMKEMSQSMQASMQAGGGDQMQEDMETLRQILDNVVLFSFDEEALMLTFRTLDVNNNKYAGYLRKQNTLKEHFEHIDDSLFALSLRTPKISERINSEISEVYFNIDKALEQLAENNITQGTSRQQFAVTAANNLADFLSDVLDNMQQSMSMSSGGGEGDMQLPDIIMSQEELNKMMEEGMKKSKEGEKKGEGEKEDGKGEKEKEGEGEKNGEGNNEGEGKDGKQSGGEGNKDSEEFLNGQLFEIYQRQQQLRNALEERLNKLGLGSEGDRILRQMENVEMDLLNNGFTKETMNKMMNIQHQLLKLENASLQQGEENKRESKTNDTNFNNSTNNQLPKARHYFNTTEILNREVLPLQQEYKRKVKDYFETSND